MNTDIFLWSQRVQPNNSDKNRPETELNFPFLRRKLSKITGQRGNEEKQLAGLFQYSEWLNFWSSAYSGVTRLSAHFSLLIFGTKGLYILLCCEFTIYIFCMEILLKRIHSILWLMQICTMMVFLTHNNESVEKRCQNVLSVPSFAVRHWELPTTTTSTTTTSIQRWWYGIWEW